MQGVGFRPFAHRIADREGLTGWIRNEHGAVRILVEGVPSHLDRFLAALTAEAPALATVESMEVTRVAPGGHGDFRIVESRAAGPGRLPIAPDAAMCEACHGELLDPKDRRHRFPFITCTDCGPRFTVIQGVPYDRERTSMAPFAQCPACRAEYASPGDRRYHSQSNSCPECGPRLWYEVSGNAEAERAPPAARGDEEALAHALRTLEGGGVLALRGLGGFHLAVDAANESAVRRLRQRKHRDAKPFAVMVRDLDEAHLIARSGELADRRLESPTRPIVILPRAPSYRLAPSVSPGLSTIGVMLPYTPLHHLLTTGFGGPLVMTSGNHGNAAIVTGVDEALDKLADLADGLLLHDRDIVQRCDDSVERIGPGGHILIRRARGLAPLPIDLSAVSPRPLLAVGSHLKNTLTLAVDGRAFVSQHIGDLDTLETLAHHTETRDALETLLGIEPEVVAHDLHPGYLSTRLALESGLEAHPVQHHHAHVAAVLAEHGEQGPAIGVAFDGTGYGPDGTVWGGEILLADLVSYTRVGHLRPALLPGGDLAAREGWRAAVGYAASSGEGPDGVVGSALRSRVSASAWDGAWAQVRHGINAPLASSMGRLFDAAAAVIGVREASVYEGQAAMELESLADPDERGPDVPFPAVEEEGVLVLDGWPLLEALATAATGGQSPRTLAAAFHRAVNRTTIETVTGLARRTGVDTVVLSGGCFQNLHLLGGMKGGLEALGLRVLVPARLPPNDGAIAFGQAAVVSAALAGIRTRLPEIGG